MTNNNLQKFSKYRVLVVGDVMIDAYLEGSVGRISPEAPVPIVDVQKRYYRLGGAANVALNLQSLGAQAIICSIIGNDEKAHLFEQLMEEQHLSTQALIHSQERKTTIKYRIIGNSRQMLRIDEEDLQYLDENESTQLLSSISDIIDNQLINAIILEDYDKGVLSEEVIQKIVAKAQAHNIIVTVDPKKRNFQYYQGVTLFKPNLKELREGIKLQKSELTLSEIEEAMRNFAKINNIEYLFTTLSERGVALYHKQTDRFYHQPAYLRKISDVSGAGDTVIAVATLCLLSEYSPIEVAQISNLAGGIVCEYAGVTPIPVRQLESEMERNHIL